MSSDEGFQDSYFDDPSSDLGTGPQKSRFVLLIGILISTFVFGTTLATNVNLGSNGPLEFGQGVQILAACSGSTPITVTPTRAFINRAGAGDYFISGFTVTNVPQSCANKDFQIKTYDSTTALALPLFPDRRTNVIVNYNGTDFVGKGSTSCNYTVTTISNSAFIVSIANAVETSTIFSKLTLESAEDFSENIILNSDTSIALSSCTSLNLDPNQAPTITGLSLSTISLSSNDVLIITGVGFTNSPVTVKFWRNRAISVTSGDGTTLAIPVAAIAAAGATTGRVVVTTPNGQAVSPTTLTILP